MPNRRWSDWPRAFGDKLNSTGGAVGLIGLGVGAVALVTPPLWVPLLVTSAGVTVAGALGWTALKSLPAKLEKPDNLLGKKLNVSSLKSIDPPVHRLGLVGAGYTGKSTLLDHVRQYPASTDRTETVYAVIVTLPTTPISYLALLDGAGGEFVQQFRVADNSSLLTILLDHNVSDSSPDIDQQRLKQHDDFLSQLNSYIRDRHEDKFENIHFLLNKEDLWAGSTKKTELLAWLNSHIATWRNSGLAKTVTASHHSNRHAASITNFIQHVIKTTQRR